jgi:hypothetical protein
VTDADLLREMTRQFMAVDQAFQQFKQPSGRRRGRRSRAKPPPPEASPNDSENTASAKSAATSASP